MAAMRKQDLETFGGMARGRPVGRNYRGRGRGYGQGRVSCCGRARQDREGQGEAGRAPGAGQGRGRAGWVCCGRGRGRPLWIGCNRAGQGEPGLATLSTEGEAAAPAALLC